MPIFLSLTGGMSEIPNLHTPTIWTCDRNPSLHISFLVSLRTLFSNCVQTVLLCITQHFMRNKPETHTHRSQLSSIPTGQTKIATKNHLKFLLLQTCTHEEALFKCRENSYSRLSQTSGRRGSRMISSDNLIFSYSCRPLSVS